MFELIHIGAILGTALFMMAIESIWFSSLLFGRFLDSGARNKDVFERYNWAQKLLSFVWYCALLFLFSHALIFFALLSISPLYGGLAIIAIYTLIDAMRVMRENQDEKNYLISLGFVSFFVLVGLHMLHFWPW